MRVNSGDQILLVISCTYKSNPLLSYFKVPCAFSCLYPSFITLHSHFTLHSYLDFSVKSSSHHWFFFFFQEKTHPLPNWLIFLPLCSHQRSFSVAPRKTNDHHIHPEPSPPAFNKCFMAVTSSSSVLWVFFLLVVVFHPQAFFFFFCVMLLRCRIGSNISSVWIWQSAAQYVGGIDFLSRAFLHISL